jgi:hypothetical protein
MWSVSLDIRLRRHKPTKKHAERTVLLRQFTGVIPVLDPEGAVRIMEQLNKCLVEIFQDARTPPSPKPMEPTNE